MSNLTHTGKVLHVGETEQVSDKFCKRLLVLDDPMSEKYPQQIPFEFVQDAVSKLDGVNIGDKVTVSFNLSGREWNGRYFGSNKGWRINVDAPAKPSEELDGYPLDEEPDVPPF